MIPAWLLRFGLGKAGMILAVLAAVVGLGGYVWYLRDARDDAEAEAARLTAEIATATQAAAENLAALERVKAEAARTSAALQAEQTASLARFSRLSELQQEVARAKVERTCAAPANDDPVAPVVDLALDGIARGVRDGADGSNQGPD